MSSPEDDMLNEGGIVPTEATPVSAIYLVPKSRIRRAADLRRKADHLYEMARLQTDAEAATACRERATLYEVLAEDLDLPRTGADPSLELE